MNDDPESDSIQFNYQTGRKKGSNSLMELDAQIIDFMKHDEGHVMYRKTTIISVIDNSVDIVPPLVHRDPLEIKYYAGELSSNQLVTDLKALYVMPVIAESI